MDPFGKNEGYCIDCRMTVFHIFGGSVFLMSLKNKFGGDDFFRHEIRLHDHQRPSPVQLVFRRESGGHIVCPPEPLQWHHSVIDR